MPRMQMQVTLETSDGDQLEKVVATGRDIRALEAEFDKSFLVGATTYTELTQLAWLALRREGRTQLDWEKFDQSCVDVEEFDEGEVDPPTPTQTDPEGG